MLDPVQPLEYETGLLRVSLLELQKDHEFGPKVQVCRYVDDC